MTEPELPTSEQPRDPDDVKPPPHYKRYHSKFPRDLEDPYERDDATRRS